MKPLILFRNDTADGFGAAFAAWLKFGVCAEYVAMNGKTIESPANLVALFGETFAERDVYLLDLSFSRAVMEWLFANAGRVVWLDHHEAAFEMWLGATPRHGEYVLGTPNTILLDNKKSGALIAWEYFHSATDIPSLFRHLDDYTRERSELFGTKELDAALESYQPWSFDQWGIFFGGDISGDSDLIEGFIAQGRSILRAREQQINALLDQARACAIPTPWPDEDKVTALRDEWDLSLPQAMAEVSDMYPLRGLAVNAPIALAPDLGRLLASRAGSFALIWSVDADLTVRCALQGKKGFDVGAIARSFGGAGEGTAARFNTNLRTLMRWIEPLGLFQVQ